MKTLLLISLRSMVRQFENEVFVEAKQLSPLFILSYKWCRHMYIKCLGIVVLDETNHTRNQLGKTDSYHCNGKFFLVFWRLRAGP